MEDNDDDDDADDTVAAKDLPNPYTAFIPKASQNCMDCTL
jgi:hypothetical protein